VNQIFSFDAYFLVPEVADAKVAACLIFGVFIDIGISDDYSLSQTILADL